MSDEAAPQAAAAAPGVAYWRERARTLGARAVVNLDHPDEAQLDDVSADHRGLILPLLAAELDGTEELVVDLGCGVGRFTDDLAGVIGGRAVGVDPTPELLALTTATDRTTFRPMTEGLLPLVDASADVVFTSMVLGGIPTGGPLEATLAEVARVLRPDGLLFLVESVAPEDEAGDGPGHWEARTAATYRDLLPWAPLRVVGSFDDAGDAVSVLAGRAARSTPGSAPRSAPPRPR